MQGMSAAILQLILGAIEEAPKLFDDAKNLFNDIAHGEGGLQKVTKAAASFAALAGHAANAASVVHGELAESDAPQQPAPDTQGMTPAPETFRGSVGARYGSAMTVQPAATVPPSSPAPPVSSAPAGGNPDLKGFDNPTIAAAAQPAGTHTPPPVATVVQPAQPQPAFVQQPTQPAPQPAPQANPIETAAAEAKRAADEENGQEC